MFNSDLNYALGLLFLSVSECERQVELSRQELCLNSNFDPYSVFKHLEINNNGKLAWTDLKNFLSKRSMAITKLFLDLLIWQYDSNQDGFLSLDEFKSFVVCNENSDLAFEALDRKVLPSLYVESLLARHIELECNWQGRLQAEKRRLFIHPEFNPAVVFRVLSSGSEGFISLISLKTFLLNFESEILNEDCERVIKRIDADNDLKISYQEFLDFILPVNQQLPNDVKLSISPVKRSKTRDMRRPRTEISPVKPKTLYESTQKIKPLFLGNEKKIFQDLGQVLKNQIEIDMKCEKSKAKFVSHLDFSFGELIKLIDAQQKNFVVHEDFFRILKDLQVPYHEDEVELLFSEFKNPEKLSYRQVKQLFVPINFKDHKRVRINREEGYRVFSADTLNDLISLLKVLLQSQVELETLRKSLTPTAISQLFHDTDKDKSNSISLSDLRTYLGLITNLREFQVRLLFRRYSKSLTKEITYSDFLEELTPKLR